MYTFESRVRYSEVDPHSKLTVEALIDYFQDCSALQSEDLGIGVDYLKDHSIGWVVNFWQIDINRLPSLGETVITGTSPYEVKGMIGLRNFIMKTPDEEVLAIANSVWTLINMETIKPARVTDLMLEKYEIFPKFDMEYVSRKLVFPEVEPVSCGSVTVSQHHIDTNGHMNNAWYFRLAHAALPDELKASPIKRLMIEYRKMAFSGDEIFIKRYVSDGEAGCCVSMEDDAGKPYCRLSFE